MIRLRIPALCLLLASLACCGEDPKDETITVGVMLPLSGPRDLGWREPLELARSFVNDAGGVAGKRLELRYADLSQVKAFDLAVRWSRDPEIRAVIGPEGSPSVFNVAGVFEAAKKPLVTPSATSADLYRAFSASGYFWRTTESDIAQVRTLLLLAAREGAESVSLLTTFDSYGATFFDWFGFFAAEMGLEVKAVVRDPMEEECAEAVALALEGAPDALVAVPSEPAGVVCITRAHRATGRSTKLYFSDQASFPSVLEALGADAEGLTGTAPGASPRSGFDIYWKIRFGAEPPAYAAHTFDALLLLAYGLERSGGEGGPALAQALREVVDGRGEAVGWDRDGVRRALEALAAGELPDISGATGSLDFDSEEYTELVSSTYRIWRVEQGRRLHIDFITTGDDADSPHAIAERSAFRTMASERHRQSFSDGGTSYEPGPREGFWALIAATSLGFDNYRHQADAWAQYHHLRALGIPDERIILILEDDLPSDPRNPEPGVVRNESGGSNLHVPGRVDYRLATVAPSDFLAILEGRASERFPKVVESGRGDDVYVFAVGHGGRQGVFFSATAAIDRSDDFGNILTPEMLAESAARMHAEERYRRLFFVVEACHGGVLGEALEERGTPGAMLLTGATPFESSFAANRDPFTGIWMADQFAYAFLRAVRETPDRPFPLLYESLYRSVSGSHVRAYNADRFGGVTEFSVGDLLRP